MLQSKKAEKIAALAQELVKEYQEQKHSMVWLPANATLRKLCCYSRQRVENFVWGEGHGYMHPSVKIDRCEYYLDMPAQELFKQCTSNKDWNNNNPFFIAEHTFSYEFRDCEGPTLYYCPEFDGERLVRGFDTYVQGEYTSAPFDVIYWEALCYVRNTLSTIVQDLRSEIEDDE